MKWLDFKAKPEDGWKPIKINTTLFQHAWRRLYLQAVNTFLDRCSVSSLDFMRTDLHHSQDRLDNICFIIFWDSAGISHSYILEIDLEISCKKKKSHLDVGAALQKCDQ